MRTVSFGLTDVGQKRLLNEDYFLIDDALGLYVVADGVGGHAKGEIASHEAVEQVAMWIRRHLREIDGAIARGDDESMQEIHRLLESGVQQACYMVFGLAELDPAKRGMSTTMSVLLCRGGMAFVAQVGDSRIYRLRGGELLQITEDHTLINWRLKHGLITADEARVSSGKNVITRAVGHKEYVQVDTLRGFLSASDRFLLCTDGLHGYLEDRNDVVELMTTASLREAAAKAIALANDKGGSDNITAVLVAVEE
ncbi:MAG: serine/threonine-protein phosphatase [Deltaproteobacteria bacterium]|nr:serine/threonine-protein phosphatase [Deltaproteobacteria bacterium]